MNREIEREISKATQDKRDPEYEANPRRITRSLYLIPARTFPSPHTGTMMSRTCFETETTLVTSFACPTNSEGRRAEALRPAAPPPAIVSGDAAVQAETLPLQLIGSAILSRHIPARQDSDAGSADDGDGESEDDGKSQVMCRDG